MSVIHTVVRSCRTIVSRLNTPPFNFGTEIAIYVHKCLELRDETEYNIFDNPVYTLDAPLPPKADDIQYAFHEGVFSSWVGSSRDSASQIFVAPNRKEFGLAMGTIMDFVISGPVKSWAHSRLHILEARFNLHELLNHDIEQLVQRGVPHRDFYNVRKIDNHVHHSACMNQKHLLRFIKAKLKKNSSEIVIVRDGKKLTLPQVFQTLNMTAYDLSVDTLDMHADKTFHRFDKFNLKYNPVGESRLREIFLKYNNYIKGKYLAEITQQVFEDLESNKYQVSEQSINTRSRHNFLRSLLLATVPSRGGSVVTESVADLAAGVLFALCARLGDVRGGVSSPSIVSVSTVRRRMSGVHSVSGWSIISSSRRTCDG
jgi:AMP deaminase